jgi:hypothetical protein
MPNLLGGGAASEARRTWPSGHGTAGSVSIEILAPRPEIPAQPWLNRVRKQIICWRSVMISTPVSNLKRRLMATFAALTVCANGVLAAEMTDDAQTQARTLLSGRTDQRVHAASHSADVSDVGRKSVTLEPQEQARRLMIGASSVGITPVDNIAVAGHMPSNSDALSAGNHSGNIDAQKIARRMLTGQGAL